VFCRVCGYKRRPRAGEHGEQNQKQTFHKKKKARADDVLAWCSVRSLWLE
jgi:hypothetical protein